MKTLSFFANSIIYFVGCLFHKDVYDNMKKWKHLHNKYNGQRVFLIGNGPSLNQTPVFLLKDEITMTFNHFDLLLERINWNPTFYMVVDATVAQDSKREIEKMVEISEYCFFPDFHLVNQVDFTKFIPKNSKVHYVHQIPKWFVKNRFSTHLPFVSLGGGTVVYDGFQILAYLGFSEIYFLGVDMNYVIHTNTDTIANGIQSRNDDDPNHFDKRYFGKGRKYHQPTIAIMHKMLSGLEIIKKNLDKHCIQSFNIGYNSKVECFDKKDFYQALNYCDDKILALFEDLIAKYGYTSYNEFESNCMNLNSITEWNDNVKLQSLPTEEAIKLVKNVILTHLPLGPYKDKIFFLKR